MDFYKRARIVCLAIPYGEAATYGQIAMLCGKPKNARQVDLKRYGWKNTMEEALEFREIFEVADCQPKRPPVPYLAASL